MESKIVEFGFCKNKTYYSAASHVCLYLRDWHPKIYLQNFKVQAINNMQISIELRMDSEFSSPSNRGLAARFQDDQFWVITSG